MPPLPQLSRRKTKPSSPFTSTRKKRSHRPWSTPKRKGKITKKLGENDPLIPVQTLTPTTEDPLPALSNTQQGETPGIPPKPQRKHHRRLDKVRSPGRGRKKRGSWGVPEPGEVVVNAPQLETESEPVDQPVDHHVDGPELQALDLELEEKEQAGVLVLEPPGQQSVPEPAVHETPLPLPPPLPLKPGGPRARRRPGKVRRRFKTKVSPASVKEETGGDGEAGGGQEEKEQPVATSTPTKPKLVGILKAKYRRKQAGSGALQFLGVKRPRGRPPGLFKETQRDLTQQLLCDEGSGESSDVPHSASRDLQRGKSRFLKNIRHFIMPVVTARSSRVIKTPKRFMDDAGMSVLPRRSSPKKAQHLTAGGGQLRGLSRGKQQQRQQQRGEEEEEEEEEERGMSGKGAASFLLPGSDLLAPDCLPEKRRSVLREPTFHWSVLGSAGGEAYTLARPREMSPNLLTPTDWIPGGGGGVDPDSPLSHAPQPSHGSAHLQTYESLKKKKKKKKKKRLTMKKGEADVGFGGPRLDDFAPSKLEETTTDPQETVPVQTPAPLLLPGPAQEVSLGDMADLEAQERAKLKIEDLDSPGVVRKVAVHLRLPSSHTHLSELGEEEEDQEMKAEANWSPKHTEHDQVEDGELGKTAARPGPREGEPDLDQSTESDRVVVEERGTAHRIRLTGANKRMFHLLKRAKVQLIKIDQQKQLKSSQVRGRKERRRRRRGGGMARGTDHEGEGRSEGSGSVYNWSQLQPGASVGSRDLALGVKRRKVMRKRKERQEAPPSNENTPQCKGCLHEEDCAKCINCLDKPKFGGPNTKRQCCVLKKCDQIEQKKLMRQGGRLGKGVFYTGNSGKRRRPSLSVCQSSEEEGGVGEGGTAGGTGPPTDGESPSLRKQPRRGVKTRSYFDLLDSGDSDGELGPPHATSPGRRRAHTPRSTDFVSLDDIPDEDNLSEDSVRQRRPSQQKSQLNRRRPDKSPQEQTPPSVLAALANGFAQREKEPALPSHRIRVDFKEDCNIRNVWLMGGLSILTSVPAIPQYVCLLCASKGQHEMVYCQVCCEPFHVFCLEPGERPLQESKENWCCRRCKFCHVCGRKDKLSKPLLECERCQNCYHPTCLGPNYPKPNKRKKSWVCMTCIRCKSCGVTPGKSWDTEWNHSKSLCPDCTKLYDQGNYCPMCFKCYEDNDYDSQMMQCSSCNHWVHAKCEGLSDDLYEILSRLPESVVYSCGPCSLSQPSQWRELLNTELRGGMEKVLACLLTSTLTTHLVHCKECQVLTDSDTGVEGVPVCDLRAVGKKFDKGLYTTLKSFHEDVVQVIRRNMEEEEDKQPEDQRPTSVARSYYLTLLEKFFNWFNGQDPKVWDPRSKDFPVGMLPNAVLPPSAEHVYAQWREREEQLVPAEARAGAGGESSEVKLKDGVHLPTPTCRRPHHRLPSRAQRLRAKGKRGRLSTTDLDTGWSKEDERQCALCQKYGDAQSNDAGRLLYLGQNEWAHVNCALWSAEVFEEENGSLMHVHSATARGRLMRCERCNQAGATVGCCLPSCQSNYHFMCARSRSCVFQEDKKVYCQKHRHLVCGKTVTGDGFEVLRRVYVDFEGISLRRKFLTGLEPESISLMIGSLQIEKLGVLTELSASQGKLFPVGYQCSRWYWSTVDPRRRCRYTCRVREVRPQVLEKPVAETPEQGDNHTIVHSPCPFADTEASERELAPPHTPVESPLGVPAPLLKQDPGARHKLPSYPQARRPAGGMSRPLPSPGCLATKSHHILTISDLEDTRRPRRHSPLSHAAPPRCRLGSPPLAGASGPITLRAGGAGAHCKPPSSTVVTPNSTSGLFPAWAVGVSGVPPPLNTGHLPLPSTVSASTNGTDSPLDNVHDKVNPPHTTSSYPGKEATQVVAADFPYPPFDVDADVAMASVLSAELGFDESLLSEDMALHCGAQIVVGAEEGADEFREGEVGEEEVVEGRTLVQAPPPGDPLQPHDRWGNGSSSSDDDMDNYFDFSRTIVSRPPPPHLSPSPQRAPGHASSSSSTPRPGAIPQLDGVDDGTESDASVSTTTATSDASRNAKSASQIPGQGQTHSLAAAVATATAASQLPLSGIFANSLDEENQSNGLANATLDTDPCTNQAIPTPPVYSSSSSTSFPVSVLAGEGDQGPDRADWTGPAEGGVVSTTTTTDNHLLGRGSPASGLFNPITPTDVHDGGTEVFLDPSSGHFVSAQDGTPVFLNSLENALSTQDTQQSVNGVGEPVSRVAVPPPFSQLLKHPAPSLSPSVQLTVTPPKLTPVPYIRTSLDSPPPPRTTVLPPMESFRNSLFSRAEPPLPLPPPAPAPHSSSLSQTLHALPSGLSYVSTTPPQSDSMGLPLTQGGAVPLGSFGRQLSLPVFPALHSSPAVSIAAPSSSSPSSLLPPAEVSATLQKDPPAPPIPNPPSSSSSSRVAVGGPRTISINFTTTTPAVRPALDQPQTTLSQGLSGHAMLTVREVGGPNVDPTPQVLLVNRFGQIFVKNPETNIFQLPTSTSASLNCIGHIASLLQSTPLSTTLGGGTGGVTYETPTPRMVTSVPQPSPTAPAATTRVITYASNGGVSTTDFLLGRQPDAATPPRPAAEKKPRKKRPSQASKKAKMAPVTNSSEAPGPLVSPSEGSSGRTGGPRILSPSQFRCPPSLCRSRLLGSVVMPPGLLIDPPAPPPESLPVVPSRPRCQVRVKRVSSLSDRNAVKRSRSDPHSPTPTELPRAPAEEPRGKTGNSNAASRPGGVRMKTPTVKGVLDLHKLQEEKQNDPENARSTPWERLLSSRSSGEGVQGKPQAWHTVGRSALTDWNKYTGALSSSEEEDPFPELDEEAPPSSDQPHLRFEISSEDGFHTEADSIDVAWRAVIEEVQEARASARLRQLSFAGMSGVRMLGMLHDAVVFLVEQLQGAPQCSRHSFRFHKQEEQEEELPVNPSGCARAEVYLRFNFLASQHRQLPDCGPYDEEEDEVPLKSTRRATSLELPMAMRFRHLEKTSKEAVGVYRSAIHGRGLFCKRNIDAGEMVIEYSGIVIRSVLTDKREKYYDSKGIGCYMFRIDDFDVVDATMHGNAARFINHSCEPNCYSRVINVEGQKHIVIFALRRIYRGEELTYDYKFPIEDAQNKLHCNCGARRCRRFLN
ncbi:KMT2B methyltransferase, partial [Amia calva]|nr:KMT2B methyltransferase [Amia calva]